MTHRTSMRSLMRSLAALLMALSIPTAAPAQVDTGTADFTRYVSIGDSLTFGVVSGSLADAGQDASYPLQIARQVGVEATFEQPTVSEPGIPGRLVLTSLSPLRFGRLAGLGEPTNLTLERPYNNLGVAGAEVNETIFRTGGDVPHDLVLRGAGSALAQAIFLEPTFATVWIGNNDVLEAALSGIVIEGETLTDPDAFAADYFTVVGALAATGANLALANLAPVTAIPFVSTIPPVVVDPATREPVLIGGQTIPLIGPDGPLASGDKVLLSAADALATGRGIPIEVGGTGEPLGDEHVLNVAELATIDDRLETFNVTIGRAALANRTAFVDVNEIFADAAENGILLGGIEYDTTLLGGLFSYDGVHASPTGYGVLANAFIEAINSRYDADIPAPALTRYTFGPEGDLGPRGQPIAAVGVRGLMKNLQETTGLRSTRKLKRLARKARRQAIRQAASGG